jgi:tetratricopeptide (TPR) repeat protein
MEYLSGNTEQAIALLGRAADHQKGAARALNLYYRGAMLNRLGRYDQALASLDQALAVQSDLLLAREERGESLWQLGRRPEAIAAWDETVRRGPGFALANYLLAGAAATEGRKDAAADWEAKGDQSLPADALFNWLLGLRLQNVGMNELAEKRFARAIELNPEFRRAR